MRIRLWRSPKTVYPGLWASLSSSQRPDKIDNVYRPRSGTNVPVENTYKKVFNPPNWALPTLSVCTGTHMCPWHRLVSVDGATVSDMRRLF